MNINSTGDDDDDVFCSENSTKRCIYTHAITRKEKKRRKNGRNDH